MQIYLLEPKEDARFDIRNSVLDGGEQELANVLRPDWHETD